ncbi:MAG: bifunctional phosphopantothenoylcysteine decarboxylase/phosphopantothenate--cysteine ligase CoaBC [SAR202 cluster bacterium]|nr:bifunctional phosphopantothenoylcysteine decarboxylase/phosphopantothenate--cysteine ligase CoaBC [SAR202 cluster bacterium]
MPNPLENKHVALGVTGSIACYKAVNLASKLVQAGALVDVVLTPPATHFVSALTFRAITHRPVVTDLWDPQSELSMDHVAMAQRADIVVIAPATADIIAKLSWGLAGDALTATVLATTAPVLVAPAMDAHMWDNAATQENAARLKARGVAFAGPIAGHLASGLSGMGRMAEPSVLLGHIKAVLGRKGDLAGRKVVVSAGGTQEDIDPVRFISNRSSGKMGYAIAEAARDRGASVVLVAAPTALPDPAGVAVVHVRSAQEMLDAVVKHARDADALAMAAAVADWRPASAAAQKVKKRPGQDTLNLELAKTQDILASVKSKRLVKVGFAAESEDLEKNARAKLAGKGLDLVVANDITSKDSGFGSDDNRVVIIGRDGKAVRHGLMSKYEVGHRVIDRIAALLK